MKPNKIEQAGVVTKIWYEVERGGLNLDFLLSSDRHHDSKYCDRDLEKRQLDEAVKRDAMVIDAGDILDAMQGKWDPRRSYDDMRPEYMVEKYYDAIIEDAEAFYKPYAANLLLIGRGNHETSVLKHASISMIDRLVGGLHKAGSSVISGGYGGWVIVYLIVGNSRSSFKIKYFHGSGGDAPVTKGVIQTNRQAVYLPDADLVLNGHNHQEYTLSIKRERVSTKGVIHYDLVHFVRTPGYKTGYTDPATWDYQHTAPSPIGAVWLNIKTAPQSNSTVYPRATLTADIV